MSSPNISITSRNVHSKWHDGISYRFTEWHVSWSWFQYRFHSLDDTWEGSDEDISLTHTHTHSILSSSHTNKPSAAVQVTSQLLRFPLNYTCVCGDCMTSPPRYSSYVFSDRFAPIRNEFATLRVWDANLNFVDLKETLRKHHDQQD